MTEIEEADGSATSCNQADGSLKGDQLFLGMGGAQDIGVLTGIVGTGGNLTVAQISSVLQEICGTVADAAKSFGAGAQADDITVLALVCIGP